MRRGRKIPGFVTLRASIASFLAGCTTTSVYYQAYVSQTVEEEKAFANQNLDDPLNSLRATKFDNPLKTHRATKFGVPSSMTVQVKDAYVVAYDWRTRNPLWVLQHLTKEMRRNREKGIHRSKSQWQADLGIPEPYRTISSDFTRSGYDRGHLAPATDVRTQNEMDETFLLTNVSPQVGEGFNRSYWNRFEEYARSLCHEYDDVYVISGPLFLPTKGKDIVLYKLIGQRSDTKIAVPTHFFKSILVQKKSMFGTSYYSASFILPNADIPKEIPLERFSVSLEELESKAGLQLWSRIQNRHNLTSICQASSCVLPGDEFWKKGKKAAATITQRN